MSLRIDAHHHLWRYTPEEYDWIDEDMRVLRRDFLLSDLRTAMSSASVDGTVVVQARQQTGETEWLLNLAASSPEIVGVVGWLPIAAPEFPHYLEVFRTSALLKGVRHVVQSEPAGFLARPDFDAGLRYLEGSNLVYDLLVFEHQLAEVIPFVDRHPKQSFVLDHLGKPQLRMNRLQPWAKQIRELARRPNVTVKISGLVTEADPANWTEVAFVPYLDTALEAFGPYRLMAGSDWPVLTVGCSYRRWWDLVENWSADWSESERTALLGGTAQRVYQLPSVLPKTCKETSNRKG